MIIVVEGKNTLHKLKDAEKSFAMPQGEMMTVTELLVHVDVVFSCKATTG